MRFLLLILLAGCAHTQPQAINYHDINGAPYPTEQTAHTACVQQLPLCQDLNYTGDPSPRCSYAP